MKRLVLERGGALCLAVLIAYIALAPAHVVSGDNAELATLGTIGGVAHPTGYPLYLIYLRLFAWLPGSAAHATAIATAILGAAQILVLHAACRAWGARPLAATLACAIYAAAAPVVRVNTAAEVFALNALCAVAIVWLAAPDGPVRGRRRVVLLALIAGLALSDHVTAVLLAPLGIRGVVRGVRESSLRSIPIGIAAFVVGLAPYLYLLVTHETPTAWTHLDGIGDLAHHVLRLDYGGPTGFASHGEPVDVATNIGAFFLQVGVAWLWLPALGAIAVLGERITRSTERWDWAMLALSFVLAGPVIAARMNLAPTGYGLYVCERFYVLPIALLVVPVAVSLGRLSLRLWLGTSIGIATFGAAIALRLPRLSRVHSEAVQGLVQNALSNLPPRAIAIVSSDTFHYVAGYVQGVLGERPDVDVIAWPLVRSAEYRERVAARTHLSMIAPHDAMLGPALVAEALGQGRPVFIDSLQGTIAGAFPTYPSGTLFRVLPKGAPLPSLDAIVEENRALYFEKYVIDEPSPRVDDEPAASAYAEYARTWTIIGSMLAANGRDPQRALGLAAELAPR